MHLFETNEHEAIDSATTRQKEANVPHHKTYHPAMELTTVRDQERVCTYGMPVATGLRKHEGRVDWVDWTRG